MSDWTNLEEIMQDLSVAQGNVVPITLHTFAADRPPAYYVEDEESEAHSSYASAAGGFGPLPAPDYRLIQEMLNMVREKDEKENASHSSNDDDEPPETYDKQGTQNKTSRRPVPKEVIPNMFKKKSSYHSEHVHSHRSENVSPPPTLLPKIEEKTEQFTPSANASAYYSKYVEKTQIREQFEQDIWAKAERQMKELEERKKLKSKLGSARERGNMSPPGDALAACAAYELALPEHRHLLPGDCMVCVVAAEHGYYF